MVVRAKKLTPEVLLSTWNRGSAVPNDHGTLALYTRGSYSFEDKKFTKQTRVLNISTGNSVTLVDSEKVHDATWIPGTNEIMWLQDGEKGNTDLMIAEGPHSGKHYKMDTIEAPFEDLKLAPLKDGIAVAFSGWADAKGSLYNEEIVEKPASSGRIYDKYYVRFWDTYCDAKHHKVIWYSKMIRDKSNKWKLAAPVHNALKYTKLESPFPYNGLSTRAGNYDISSSGIVFVAMDPDCKPQDVTSTAYFVPLSTFVEEKAPEPRKLIPDNEFHGMVGSPRFSPCGKRVLFTAADNSRSIDTRIKFVPDITKSLSAMDLFRSSTGEHWDLIPSGVEWSKTGKSIYITSEQSGRICLFHLSLTAGRDLTPKQLTQEGTVSGHYELGASSQILVSSSSFIDPSIYSIVDLTETHSPFVLDTLSQHGKKLGISPEQVSEIYFEGGIDYCVHAWVFTPPNFDPKKKYPLAFLIHGGPADAWRNSFSTRWNPLAWAAQGYVCVMPNPTGSLGYGIDFTEAMYNSWGGRPYDDLVKCFEYIEENMSYVDTKNAIAAGASYGGYMANWIQGNDLGRKFKTIVCHDGIFDLQSMIACDYFTGEEDFDGPMLPWLNHKNLQRYNPARPDKLANWSTPMLIVHSDKDYRCNVTDGLAAFAVCQSKGLPSKYLNFPDEGHWVLKPENSLLWHNTVFDWVNGYSGISAERAKEDAFESLAQPQNFATILHDESNFLDDDLWVPRDGPDEDQPMTVFIGDLKSSRMKSWHERKHSDQDVSSSSDLKLHSPPPMAECFESRSSSSHATAFTKADPERKETSVQDIVSALAQANIVDASKVTGIQQILIQALAHTIAEQPASQPRQSIEGAQYECECCKDKLWGYEAFKEHLTGHTSVGAAKVADSQNLINTSTTRNEHAGFEREPQRRRWSHIVRNQSQMTLVSSKKDADEAEQVESLYQTRAGPLNRWPADSETRWEDWEENAEHAMQSGADNQSHVVV